MFFRRKIQHEEPNEEPNYWMSFSDFAFNFLISFILLTSLILADQYKKNAEIESAKQELEEKYENIKEDYAVRKHIAEALYKEFQGDKSVTVNRTTGTITLSENAIEFYPDSPKLKSNAQYIDNFFKRYIKALQSANSPKRESGSINYYKNDYINRIIIEGHVNKVNPNSTGMELSQERALTVYNRIYPQIKDNTKLKKKVQAVGRGHFVQYGDGNSASANRRVEFHFTLNEEKIVKEQQEAIMNAQHEIGDLLFQ